MRYLFLFVLAACVGGCGNSLDPRRLNTEVSAPSSTQGHGWYHPYHVAAEPDAARAGLTRRQVARLVEDMLLRGLRRQNYSVEPHEDRSDASILVSVTSLSYDRQTGMAEGVVRIQMPRKSFDQTYRFGAEPAEAPGSKATQYAQVGLVLRSILNRIVNDPQFLAALDRSDEDGPGRSQQQQQQEQQQTSGPSSQQSQQQQQQQQPLRRCAPGETPRWESYTQHVPGPERYRLTCEGPGAPPHPGNP